MKGLLRGMWAMGLLAGGVLGAGCGKPDMGPQTDTHKTPIQQKYQAPTADEANPPGDPRKNDTTRSAGDEPRDSASLGSPKAGEAGPGIGGGSTASDQEERAKDTNRPPR